MGRRQKKFFSPFTLDLPFCFGSFSFFSAEKRESWILFKYELVCTTAVCKLNAKFLFFEIFVSRKRLLLTEKISITINWKKKDLQSRLKAVSIFNFSDWIEEKKNIEKYSIVDDEQTQANFKDYHKLLRKLVYQK